MTFSMLVSVWGPSFEINLSQNSKIHQTSEMIRNIFFLILAFYVLLKEIINTND